MIRSDAATQTTVILCSLFFVGGMLVGCSSTPDPQAEPSKTDIQKDSDRFFNKMNQEEIQQSP